MTPSLEKNSKSGIISSSRLEAFSDGVFAIVITILILEITVPHLSDPGSSTEAITALVELGPKFLGYLLSFFFIAVFWINHHWFFTLIRQVDNGLLWRNIALLLSISFVPFPTGMIGEYPLNPIGVALFSLVLMTAGIAFNLMWRHARNRGLYLPDVQPAFVNAATTKGVIGPLLYAVAGITAFINPPVSWIIFFVIPGIYAFK